MVQINQIKKVAIDVKTMSIFIKVTDRFNATFYDQDGQLVGKIEDDYAPDFMPGAHGGDYLDLLIDLDTGQIKNWEQVKREDLEKVLCEVALSG